MEITRYVEKTDMCVFLLLKLSVQGMGINQIWSGEPKCHTLLGSTVMHGSFRGNQGLIYLKMLNRYQS